MSGQVDTVRRKLMASLHKPVVEDAVRQGFVREEIEQLLVLCHGDADVLRRQFARWKATRTAQQDREDSRQMPVATFIAWLAQQPPLPKRRDIKWAEAALGRTRKRKKQQ